MMSDRELIAALRVAPLAGAWIEMPVFAQGVSAKMVAPLAGAWIEILESRLDKLISM